MRFPRKPLLALSLLGIAVVVPAVAQTPAPSSYPPACEDSRVTKADRDRAHTVFISGKQYLEESNYDKAISYFKDAYSIDCSVHGILPIIATAYERKGDRREAVHALEEYQKRAPTAGDHEVIDRRIRNLKDQIAQEQPVPSVTAPTPSATAPATTASVEPSASAALVAPAPTPQEEGPHHTAGPWILFGLGWAAPVAGIVAIAIGAGKVSNAEKVCGTQHNGCPAGSPAIDDGNSGRSLELVGGIVTGVGLAAVAGGLVWHFLEKPSRAPAAGVHVQPVVSPGYAGVSLGGGFN
jgi:hypothetical protein